MRARSIPSNIVEWPMPRISCALSLSLTFLTLALGGPTLSQEPMHPAAESIADAARNARERQPNSTKPQKVFTNDDLPVQPSLPSVAAATPESSPKQAEVPAPQQAEAPAPTQAEVPPTHTADCKNPDEQRLKTELQDAQNELGQLRRELSYDPKVISDGDVDLKNFKSGSSGVAFGSPPLLQSQPQAPARVSEVMVEERIASLKEALRVACDSPKVAGIQKELDSSEKDLQLLQRQFDLDRAAYYSMPNYANDTTGKARLDAEQQQMESLQSQIERLKHELPPPKSNQVTE